MAQYSVTFRVANIYQGMPLPVVWAITGSTQAASAVAQISIGGNVFWTSQPVQLSMAAAFQNVVVPPPNDSTVAMMLYDASLPAGIKTVHIDVSVNVGGTVTIYSAD